MIGTEFINGQGLGNQLFCYVTARAIAMKKGCEFGIAGAERLGVNIHSDKGMYFMDIDLGQVISEADKKNYAAYHEKEERLFVGNSKHDVKNGCYVTGADENIANVEDDTLIYGNMQAESYFAEYSDSLKDWLHVKPEYESKEYTRDNLCIINMRGGEYIGSPELYLRKKYWVDGMKAMRKIRPDMEFMIVTEDVRSANKMFPDIPAYHFDMGRDYVTIKNARYLLLSNSSFACLAAFTSDELKYAIAPKYWARHNVSDGYWASEQNIYSIFHYMDRKGRVFDADECRSELQEYKLKSRRYRRLNVRPTGVRLMLYRLQSELMYRWSRVMVIARGVMRRVRKYGIQRR